MLESGLVIDRGVAMGTAGQMINPLEKPSRGEAVVPAMVVPLHVLWYSVFQSWEEPRASHMLGKHLAEP